MSKRTQVLSTFTAMLTVSFLFLAGCGGGGSSSDFPKKDDNGGGGGTVPSPSVSVRLTDSSSGAASNTLSLGAPLRASATVLAGPGQPVANTVVTFTADPAGLAVISPVAGTALTDANGVASLLLAPAGISSAGAGTLTAKATVSAVEYSASTGFQVGAATVGLANLAVSINPLAPYATTAVGVDVTGVPPSVPVTVEFTSACVGSGKATLPASVQSSNGRAVATYTDNGCGPTTDTITATVQGTNASASTKLQINQPANASIQFVSATPETIVLKGTGGAGLSDSSVVKFKVVDANNNPRPNTMVDFDLTTRSGGILLDGPTGTGPVSKQTNAAGEVEVAVLAGTNPTAVWVVATIAGTSLQTQSVRLVISTGRPAQNRVSLSVGQFNIEGLDRDGESTSVTAIMSDRLGNPVPNGTAINFITSGGQIEPSCQTGDPSPAGQCTVRFTSANPRPASGRVNVTAYAVGEESFNDANGNNRYDAGEPFGDLGDVFVDNNFNTIYDAPEENRIAFGKQGACGQPLANSPYAPSAPNTCDRVWGAAHVRQSSVVILSGSTARTSENRLSSPSQADDRTLAMGGQCERTFNLFLFDSNLNPMPSGTKLTVATVAGSASASVPVGGTVPDSIAQGGTQYSLAVAFNPDPLSPSGGCKNGQPVSVVLEARTPNSTPTSLTLTVNP